MKKYSIVIFFLFSFCAFGQVKQSSLLKAAMKMSGKPGNISISSNHSDAQIMVDNASVGNGSAVVNLMPILLTGKCAKISASKVGYYSKEVELCPEVLLSMPQVLFLELEKDEAIDASVQTDISNVDLVITLKKSQEESWRDVNSLLLNYIDVIETSDKSLFYVRTAWVAQNFNSGIVRTRLIVKSVGSDQFSIKIISELASPGSSVKDDEKFIPWDRVLRKYAPIIEELQSRL